MVGLESDDARLSGPLRAALRISKTKENYLFGGGCDTIMKSKTIIIWTDVTPNRATKNEISISPPNTSAQQFQALGRQVVSSMESAVTCSQSV